MNGLGVRFGIILILALSTLGSHVEFGASFTQAAEGDAPATLPEVSAETAIVIDDATYQILYAKDPHKRMAPASLTKMVTAIVALDRGKLTDRVVVDVDSALLVAETASSVMGLMPGDELTLEQLLYGLLLPSGADAAIAIAEHIGGSESRFVEMMNQKVRGLGLHETRFVNPHGLDEEGQYSTVYDMAIIARYAMQYPTIQRIVGIKKTMVKFSEGTYEKEVELYNANPLIGKYRGADGVKPGFTDEAGLAIAATAKRGDRRLYVVLIRSEDLVKDSSKLFDYYFPKGILFSPRNTVLFPLQPAGK